LAGTAAIALLLALVLVARYVISDDVFHAILLVSVFIAGAAAGWAGKSASR
jgi:hypothetical protein